MEPTTEQLLEQVRALYKRKKYKDIIDLLPDSQLVRYNNAKLYIYAGIGHGSIHNTDKAIELYTRAIALNPNDEVAFYDRGLIFTNTGQTEKAIEDYTEAIKLDPAYARAYNNRGTAFHRMGQYEKAIEDFDRAIKLDADYALAYYNRGLSFRNLGKNDKSIDDYTQAIRLKANYPSAYNNRGFAYGEMGQHHKAIEDYNEAIKLNANHTLAYNNRGIAWRNLGKLDLSFADYTTAIEKGAKEIFPYRNRGKIYFEKEDYQAALKDYKKALEIDPNDTTAKYQIDLINTKLGRPITVSDEPAEKSFYLLKTLLRGLPDEKQIMQLAADILAESIKKIQDFAAGHSVEKVAHYTKLHIADILVSGEDPIKLPRLRYYNAVYMNDPEEGGVLLRSFDGEINKAFNAGKQDEDSNIYLGSFLDAKKHKDELVMWRTYGKDEKGIEAAGCSVIINATFFDKGSDGLNAELVGAADVPAGGPAGADALTSQPLYRVLYYDKRDNQFLGDERIALEPLIQGLKERLAKLIGMKDDAGGNETEKDKAINKIIYHMLSEIRYLFKSADYAFENEYRVIQYAPITSPKIQIDKLSIPKRLFVESNSEVLPHIDEIFLGSKVPNPDQWIYMDYLLKKKDKKKRLSRSDCKFQ